MTTAQWPQQDPQVQFHVLSFEGPDPYAQAGGIASRITGLTQALATAGFETHLWFIGDPDLSGHETRGQLRLHRWCQWLSGGYPDGVYAGEETNDPWEFVNLFGTLHTSPTRERALRQAGQRTAQHYAWPQIIDQVLLPRLQLLARVPLMTSTRKPPPRVYAV